MGLFWNIHLKKKNIEKGGGGTFHSLIEKVVHKKNVFSKIIFSK